MLQNPSDQATGVVVGVEVGGGDHVAAGLAVGLARAPVVAHRQRGPQHDRAAGGRRSPPPVSRQPRDRGH